MIGATLKRPRVKTAALVKTTANAAMRYHSPECQAFFAAKHQPMFLYSDSKIGHSGHSEMPHALPLILLCFAVRAGREGSAQHNGMAYIGRENT
jgi:hypothetical protein